MSQLHHEYPKTVTTAPLTSRMSQLRPECHNYVSNVPFPGHTGSPALRDV